MSPHHVVKYQCQKTISLLLQQLLKFCFRMLVRRASSM